MALFSLALRSLRSRLLSTGLTVFSIALSISLLAAVDTLQRGTKAGFAGTISRTDLIAGARGGDVSLLLSTVFHLGSPSNEISWQSYQHFAHHPAVAWTVPISMGDSFHGYRVIATDGNLYEHYRYRGNTRLAFSDGNAPQQLLDTALGATVATQLHLKRGQQITLAHGVEAHSILNHDAVRFTITGILQRTSTPIDNAVFIGLLGEEALHAGWEGGTPPAIGEATPALDPAKLQVSRITAFLLGSRSRVSTLYLQREIDTYKPEPLTAIIPAYTLQELWVLLDYADEALSLVSASVLVVGLLAMLASLYTTLNERRREIAILRALGVHHWQVALLFVSEAMLITLAGATLGLVAVAGGVGLFHRWLERKTGLPLQFSGPSERILLYAIGAVFAAAVIALVPAWRAYRNSLGDGLRTS